MSSQQDHRDRSGAAPRAPNASTTGAAPGKRSLVEDLVPGTSTAPASASLETTVPGAAPQGAATPASRSPPSNPAKTDAQLLEHQAGLKGPDVEIPALEGALLATRQAAVQKGLLSKESYDAGLALSRAMTQLQPAVAANGKGDFLLQETAANAAQLLLFALQRETSAGKNFKVMTSSPNRGIAVTSQNPYTEEARVSTYFTQTTVSPLQRLPGLIRQDQWADAFRDYRRMLEGLDLWAADQLRSKGKGTPEEALGDAQQYYSQLRTALEPIAGKHASRLPALFHPDAKTLMQEKSAGRPVADTIPMNVYVWKDEQDGKFHIQDLTTPSRPHEQTLDGPPTAAAMKTFFEDVARYPEGQVHYTLPNGGGGVAPTTGKTKWYEWVGYAGLAIAALGLALVSAGASVPATVCFAAGAVAGGLSASGHLVDTARLGTTTTATIVLDLAQVAASFASFGALSLTLKAGGAAAALASSRWFIPLVRAAATADVVQLVALTDITFVQLTKIQAGAGTPDDKQRAMSVLLTQLVVTGGLAALSVQGARSAHALAGQPLEIVEQNGACVLRVAGEGTLTPKPSKTGAHEPGPSGADLPESVAHSDTSPASSQIHDAEHWLIELEHSLTPAENAKLAKMKLGKTPQQMRDMLGGDFKAAHERVQSEVRLDQQRADIAAQSKERVAELRKQIAERGLMEDPEVRSIIDRTTPKNLNERVRMLRDKLVAKTVRAETEHAHPGAEVMDGVKIYEKLPERNINEWAEKHPKLKKDGLTDRADGLYIQRAEIDMLTIERQPGGKSRIVSREEVKTGARDTNADARKQLEEQSQLLHDAAAGKKEIRMEVGGHDIASELDLGSDMFARKITRGPARKGFDESLGVSVGDLEALCKDLLSKALAAKGS